MFGVGERGDGTGFGEQTAPRGFVSGPGVQDLECYVTFEAVIAGAPDLPHAT